MEKPGLKENDRYTEEARKELISDIPAVFPDISITETYDLMGTKGKGGVMVLCRLNGEFTQIMLTEKMLMFIPIPDEYTKAPARKKAAAKKEKTEEKEDPHVIQDIEESMDMVDDRFDA